ncbi:hypothetical protein LOTGIDRAFT_164136 [Lottia gigantea]|uniref:Endonuclease/exonuclease/phosphatase domain-containing protein n=1 Tax=Lottia gigantea TaxID=225164 RepID=V3ZH35_LOTGI|nr:hypothetical protein LOTGIDRAFT_164136 [Lottia gigantea]ESO90548.1 hypothetical protein LOTGIDRAFT_164136 [Lottia gigantea]
MGKHRPIVARFIHHADLVTVKRKSYMLKGKSYGINEQYPQVIEAKQRTLYPIMKEFREKGHKVRLIRDRLYINDILYSENEQFSDNLITDRPNACWIDERDDIGIEGYTASIYPRKTGKGGGTVIFISNSIIDNCSIIKNVHDCIVVVKIVSHNLEIPSIILIACYFPPQGSVFYDNQDFDPFVELQDLIIEFSCDNNILMVVGDLNSRTFVNDDFIQHDKMNPNSELIGEFCNMYEPDSLENLCCRKNMDNVVNSYGRMLLSLCIMTGMRIVNGRLNGDREGNFTFCSSKGSGLIDYLILRSNHFNLLSQFSTGSFTEFSDHSPLCFKINFHVVFKPKCLSSDIVLTKWNDSKREDIKLVLKESMNQILTSVTIDNNSQTNVDQIVDTFSVRVSELLSPYNRKVSSIKRSSKLRKTVDKPWFNDLCKSYYVTYKSALKTFNKKKSVINRINLTECRQRYKKFEMKLKNNYLSHQGNMLDLLRMHNPKKIPQAI